MKSNKPLILISANDKFRLPVFLSEDKVRPRILLVYISCIYFAKFLQELRALTSVTRHEKISNMVDNTHYNSS